MSSEAQQTNGVGLMRQLTFLSAFRFRFPGGDRRQPLADGEMLGTGLLAFPAGDAGIGAGFPSDEQSPVVLEIEGLAHGIVGVAKHHLVVVELHVGGDGNIGGQSGFVFFSLMSDLRR